MGRIRRFNDPNTGRWAPVLTHISAVIGNDGKNLKTILEELQTKVDNAEGGIQDGEDIADNAMEEGKLYLKDGKLYFVIESAGGDASTEYQILILSEDGIQVTGYDTSASSTYTNELYAPAIKVVNHGTSDTTFTLPPNEFHIWGEVGSLTLSFATPTDSNHYNEYMFEFESGSTETSLILNNSSILWQETPEIEANKKYQVSIVNNIGLIVGVSTT